MEHYLVDVLDYEGTRVVLVERTWRQHILMGHPELADSIEQLASVLQTPHVVYESANASTRHVYYRLNLVGGRNRFLYLAVVVRYDVEPARVVTAYVTGMPSGAVGRMIYCDWHK